MSVLYNAVKIIEGLKQADLKASKRGATDADTIEVIRYAFEHTLSAISQRDYKTLAQLLGKAAYHAHEDSHDEDGKSLALQESKTSDQKKLLSAMALQYALWNANEAQMSAERANHNVQKAQLQIDLAKKKSYLKQTPTAQKQRQKLERDIVDNSARADECFEASHDLWKLLDTYAPENSLAQMLGHRRVSWFDRGRPKTEEFDKGLFYKAIEESMIRCGYQSPEYYFRAAVASIEARRAQSLSHNGSHGVNASSNQNQIASVSPSRPTSEGKEHKVLAPPPPGEQSA